MWFSLIFHGLKAVFFTLCREQIGESYRDHQKFWVFFCFLLNLYAGVSWTSPCTPLGIISYFLQKWMIQVSGGVKSPY